MGLLLMMMSCVTSLSVVILLTIQGVCGEEWSVTYQPKRTCAFVGSSVDLSCSYTYPSGLSIRQVFWTKHNYTDPPPLLDDPEYSHRISEGCDHDIKRCNLRIDSLTKLDTGKYYCRITTYSEGQNWIGTPGIYLDVKDVPQISVSFRPPGDIQEGTDVTLTCTSTSDLPVRRYSWHKSYNHIAMEKGKTYTIKHFRPEKSGQYQCWLEYKCGRSYSATVRLQVSYPPKNTRIESDPSGEMIEGSRVTLTCMSEADPPVHTYTWIKKSGAVELKPGKEKTLIFSKIRSEDRGEYLCQAANRIGQQDSPAMFIQVLYPPKNTRIESDPSGEMIEGSTVTLTCMSEADPPVHTYTWIKKSGAVQLKSGKEKTLIFSKIRSEDRGEYLCQAANRIGQQDSPAVSLQVIYTPKDTSVSVRPDVITKGSSVNLTCSSDANPPVEIYTWFKVNESTPVGSGQQYRITNIRSEDGGQYYCEARNEYGAGNSSIVSVIVEGYQSSVLIAVVAVSICGLVCLLCAFVGVKKMKMRKKAEEQRSSIKLQSRGGAEDDVQYSTIQPHGSRETAGGAEDDVLYSTIQPHDAGETAGAQGDDVQYSSVQLKKGGAVYGSPNQPEGELSVIYSSVETKA